MSLRIWTITITNELAHYLKSFDMTVIESTIQDNYQIRYTGRWGRMFLSFLSSAWEIQNQNSGKIYQRIYKNKKWIYNHLEEGS